MNDDFSRYADGKTLCTAFLQEAIDRVPPNGRLTIPAGTYLTGSLFLHSDMTLELAEGAVILGVVTLGLLTECHNRSFLLDCASRYGIFLTIS